MGSRCLDAKASVRGTLSREFLAPNIGVNPRTAPRLLPKPDAVHPLSTFAKPPALKAEVHIANIDRKALLQAYQDRRKPSRGSKLKADRHLP